MHFKTIFSFSFQNTCIFKISLCTLGIAFLRQTKFKISTNLCPKNQSLLLIGAWKPEWVLEKPQPQLTHTTQKPIVSLWPQATDQPTSSRWSTLHYHGQATVCKSSSVSGSYSKTLYKSTLGQTQGSPSQRPHWTSSLVSWSLRPQPRPLGPGPHPQSLGHLDLNLDLLIH